MNTSTFLTEKQLKNLTTQRLQELRKVLIKPLKTKQFNKHDIDFEWDSADAHALRALETYYDLVKETLSKRGHLEKKKTYAMPDRS